ncbi:MAG: hypothetical protein K2Y14_10750 [Burkholderiales bacterium]|nr:hypothetical protein [Burkholderiales bacterium]
MQIIYTVLYILSQSSIGVIIGYIGLKASPIAVLLSISIISTLFFSALQISNLKNIYGNLLSNKLLAFKLFISTALCWAFVYWGTIYGSPGLELILMILFAGICASVVQRKYMKTLLSLSIFVAVCTLLPEAKLTPVILGVFSGVFAYLFQVSSYRLFIECNINETQILAVRFLPFILILSILGYHYNSLTFNHNMLLPVLLVSILIIVPTFLTQKCINILGAEKFSYISGLIPLSTFIIQDLTNVSHTDLKTYILIIVLTIVLVLGKK